MAKRERKTTVGIYLRVSTTDKNQETDNQLLQLKELCKRMEWVVYDTTPVRVTRCTISR